METSAASPLDQMLCFDIYAVNLAFGRVYKPLLEPFGLTYPQFLVLLSLWARDGQSIGQIGSGLGLDSSTLTPLVKRLETAGWVTRRRDLEDERRVIVEMTHRGRDLEAQSGHIMACVTKTTGLDVDEIRQLQSVLGRLRHTLQTSPSA